MADPFERLRSTLADRYRVERELGRGGMAVVFLAEDLKHHRRVAIKVLDPELAAVLGPERFLREIEIAARLQHPHILPLLDSGAADGLLYYVMPFVEGESLRERLVRERQLPVNEALRLTTEIAHALDFAHRQGLVHRDIKPENILLSGGQAVVADFGIARAIRAAGGAKLTETGTSLGTPTYMSPEQVLGSDDLDGRSDLYGLGCLLYEMLAGQPPFTGPTAESVVHQHLAAEPPLVTAVRPTVPESVARAVTRALAKAPADRFTTASEFVDALATPASQRTPEPTAPRATFRAQRPIMVAAAGVIGLIAALAIAGWQGLGPLSKAFGAPPIDASKKELILVAEFEGPSDKPDLAAAVHDLLSTALDQSEIVATVPSDELKLALRQAGKPDSSRIDAALAREIAYRRAVRAVVEGRISRVGKGYSIAIRVVDVDSSKTVLSLGDIAVNEEALIPTISRLGRKLRTELGEKRSAIRAERPLVDVLTPSFEAFRRYLKAQELASEELDPHASIAALREALGLDPDFASAWSFIGTNLQNLGKADSARAAYSEALRRPNRLTDYARLVIEAKMAWASDDLPAAVSAYDRILRGNLTPSRASAAYNNRAALLSKAGREEEALESYQKAAAAAPFGPKQLHLNNIVHSLYVLGRLDEARSTTSRLKDRKLREDWELAFAVSGSNWTAAESLGAAIQEDQTKDLWRRGQGAVAAASGETVHGSIRAAFTRLRRAQESCATKERTAGIWPWWEEVMLATCCSRAVPAYYSMGAEDTAATLLVNKGLWAAAAGDTNLARRTLRYVRGYPRLSENDRSATYLIEGWIAARSSRWDEVVRLLGAMAGPQNRPGSFDMELVRTPMRWLVADAHEHLGQPDSAAAVLELMVKERYDEAAVERGICHPFALRRLVLLYARMGRAADARRHWDVFAATFTRPDPDMVPLMDEARSALASAEGMAGSVRR